eukprot:1139524-Pelagomonas_calceolata.AAC.15
MEGGTQPAHSKAWAHVKITLPPPPTGTSLHKVCQHASLCFYHTPHLNSRLVRVVLACVDTPTYSCAHSGETAHLCKWLVRVTVEVRDGGHPVHPSAPLLVKAVVVHRCIPGWHCTLQDLHAGH